MNTHAIFDADSLYSQLVCDRSAAERFQYFFDWNDAVVSAANGICGEATDRLAASSIGDGLYGDSPNLRLLNQSSLTGGQNNQSQFVLNSDGTLCPVLRFGLPDKDTATMDSMNGRLTINVVIAEKKSCDAKLFLMGDSLARQLCDDLPESASVQERISHAISDESLRSNLPLADKLAWLPSIDGEMEDGQVTFRSFDVPHDYALLSPKACMFVVLKPSE